MYDLHFLLESKVSYGLNERIVCDYFEVCIINVFKVIISYCLLYLIIFSVNLVITPAEFIILINLNSK